jgi:hypothetical protein
MGFTISSRSVPECLSYLYIIDGQDKLTLDDFAEKHHDENLDELIRTCQIEYRGKLLSYSDLVANHVAFSRSLPFFNRYTDEIYPQEIFIMFGNYSYYISAKFLRKAEDCLQNARYYLMKSETILDYNCNAHWTSGYGAQFSIRATNLATAIIWYNSCFDYVLQIVYLAFELYKQFSKYSAIWTIDDILKKCSYPIIRDIYNANSTNANFSVLWGLIEGCRIALIDVNEWANYIKHKGGIKVQGLTPDSPIQASMSDPSGNIVAATDEFSPVQIDLDDAVINLQKAHQALYNCLDQVVTFIDYHAAIPTSDASGTMQIPDPSIYVKITLP